MITKKTLYGLTGATIAVALVLLVTALLGTSSQRGVRIALGCALVVVALAIAIAARRTRDE